MDFHSFATGHGLIIKHVEYGKWIRTPTEDHPKSKNGAFKHLGEVAWVQNHATMTEPATWFPDSDNDITINREGIQKLLQKAARERALEGQRAAKKALGILSQCQLQKHAYFDGKGFPEELGNVFVREGFDPLLCIPMRIGSRVVGLQTISIDGEKKFLFGQVTSGAEFLFDGKGQDWFCEGYATGLSLKAALNAIRARYRIHVTFSAHNLKTMAAACDTGLVVADNDASGTGEKAARESGRRFFLPPTVGQDFNDLHREVGLFRVSQMLRRFVMESR